MLNESPSDFMLQSFFFKYALYAWRRIINYGHTLC